MVTSLPVCCTTGVAVWFGAALPPWCSSLRSSLPCSCFEFSFLANTVSAGISSPFDVTALSEDS